ncbi:DUF7426 family protein [Prescottella equi]|uniref:DUF7426 family protein n=1 Tax=Rhodococcus hoagii TaxID=43767 RepID=UPI000A0FE99A|nr:hypothetical protein [Prescottella equi]ORL06454.1 hypothetical protein A6I84_19175 [Prescottella equi]
MDDLAAFMDPALRLPIGGREYAIECSAHQGLHLHRLFSDPGRVLNDTAERAEILQMLGGAHQQMVDDGIGWPRIAHAGRTALFWFGISPDAGRRYWESGGDAAPGNPLPPSPNRSAMGERLSQIFRTQPRADRLLLTTARRSSPASAEASAEEP